ncbi:hypothetical protein CASFOL_028538 [Castilleja foliolosa]|uniref:Uncharacterized protein n=1 Tax=Castilleja foliolosa TaxID=1961234 RepID=A0ABD3CEG6_9LAMI
MVATRGGALGENRLGTVVSITTGIAKEFYLFFCRPLPSPLSLAEQGVLFFDRMSDEILESIRAESQWFAVPPRRELSAVDTSD